MYLPEMASAPGSVSQVRECASRLMRLGKASGCRTFLVGHVTKEGSIAGPRVLEHMVDAVRYFEGDRQHQYRLLRAVKNRFGSVNELGMFEMAEEGMVEVGNASEVLLSQRAHDASGSVVMCAMEGSRPLLTDVQALVAPTLFGNPRRMASGVDQGRLALLLAVLEKRVGLRLFDKDVYINIAGGMTLTEPAADLALCAAVASSLWNITLPRNAAVVGEVGLSGEIRAIAQAERRMHECMRMGFDLLVLPRGNLKGARVPEGMRAIGADTLPEALNALGLIRPGREA
jgi:DNA repair protein RadA/Sms